MLDRLIDFAVHRRVLALLISAGFAIFGAYTFTKLKVEAFPDVTNVQVMVISLYPGQAAEEVEKKVTIPIERALTGTPRVLVQRSITSFGLSLPTLYELADRWFGEGRQRARLRRAAGVAFAGEARP